MGMHKETTIKNSKTQALSLLNFLQPIKKISVETAPQINNKKMALPA